MTIRTALLMGFAAAFLPAVSQGQVGGQESLAAVDLAPASIHEALDDDLYATVGLTRGENGATRRFYVTPIIGTSWGTLSQPDFSPAITNDNLFTAGGAVGVAWSRPKGQLRLETDIRYRDDFSLTEGSGLGFAQLSIVDNWSVLANLWRDIAITETMGVYAGGGIGAGGYTFRLNQEFGDLTASGRNGISEFAWQAGGGLLWAVSDRITLDLGYRFYSVGAGSSQITISDMGQPIGQLPIETQFVASELLLGVRIYEPFRRWR